MGLFDWGNKSNTGKLSVNETDLIKGGYSKKQAKEIVRVAKLENVVNPGLFNIEETKVGFNPIDMLKMGMMHSQSLKDYAKNAFNLSTALISLWSQAVNDRRSYIMVSSEIRKFYIVEHMLELIKEDVLNPDQDGTIIKFISDDEKIQEELNDLYEKFDFNNLLWDFVGDFIDFGEYSLQLTAEEGKGLTAINDDLDQLNVIAFYEEGWPIQYLHYMDNDYVIEPAHKIAHFIMGDSKMRVALEDQLASGYALTQKRELPPELAAKIPDYIRIGKPLFFNIIAKLRELQILETLIPASKLNQITQTQIVGVKVPSSLAPEKVIETLRKYEDLLNIPIGIDKTREQLSIAEIMTAAGKIRCIPLFDDGKGSIETIDARKSQAVDDILNSIRDIRAVICCSIGIPPSLLYGSEDKEKSQELRLFSRYTRKLRNIQNSIAKGLKQIIAVHLRNKGFANVNSKSFDVKFVQPLTDISGLEYAELMDARQELAGRTLDFIDKFQANKTLVPYINEKHLIEWVRDKFAGLTEDISLFNDMADPTKVQRFNDRPVSSTPGVPNGTDGEPKEDDDAASTASFDRHTQNSTQDIEKSQDFGLGRKVVPESSDQAHTDNPEFPGLICMDSAINLFEESQEDEDNLDNE